VAAARGGVEKMTLNVKVKRRSAATFVSISEVDEQAPLYQVRNLSAAHVVHVWQPTPLVKGTALAVSVGPGKVCRWAVCDACSIGVMLRRVLMLVATPQGRQQPSAGTTQRRRTLLRWQLPPRKVTGHIGQAPGML